MSDAFVSCECCGCWVPNTPEDNAGYEDEGHEPGYGLCVGCGGDPKVKEMSVGEINALEEEVFWKLMGSAYEMFFRSRIEHLMEILSDENRSKLEAKTHLGKIAVVSKLIENGSMI